MNKAARALLGEAIECLGTKNARATDICAQILKDYPDNLPALQVMGVSLMQAEKPAEAFGFLERARDLAPDESAPHFHLGQLYLSLNRAEEALESFERARDARNPLPRVHNRLASALLKLNRLEEARVSLRKAQEVAPEDHTSRVMLAFTFLKQGDFKRGWKEYQHRLKDGKIYCGGVLPSMRFWDGSSPVKGKRMVLIAEQGNGDNIQFVRYASLLQRRGAEVSVLCPSLPGLRPLLERAQGVAEVRESLEGRFDLLCPMMSLPFCFQTTEDTIPSEVPYIVPDRELQMTWSERLRSLNGGLRVGVFWQSEKHPNSYGNWYRARNSLPITAARSWFDLPGVSWVSLQKGITDEDSRFIEREGVFNSGPLLDDFGETGALISTLDLVISVDTAVAHLAGALNVPTITVLRYDSEWRWLEGRPDSPWYPSMTLYRQQQAGDWSTVIDDVRDRLVSLSGR